MARPTTFEACEPALSRTLVGTLNRLKFTTMTPVQAATIPLFLSHKDVAVEACTGSGKTLAFLIPIVEMLMRREEPLGKFEIGALVVSPTRELAKQIFDVFESITNEISLAGALLVGGTSVAADMKLLRERAVDVLVATPGRMLDLLQRDEFPMSVRELEVLVLDEADVLLDLGFERTLNDIFKILPKQRRTGLFSATQTKAVRALARAGMRNPVRVSVKVQSKTQGGGATQRTPTQLESFYHVCKLEEKVATLVDFLRRYVGSSRGSKAIVFVATCASVDYLSAALPRLRACRNLRIMGLHGKMVQKRRAGTFKSFSAPTQDDDERSCVLLCTDVAARGLDVPDVSWIVQFDPPKDPDFFVHRVGRTARAGRSGRALVILLESEIGYVEYMAMCKVPMSKWAPDPASSSTSIASIASSTFEELRRIAREDRDIMEKGLRAFVSFVRAYKNHILQDIFSFSKIRLGAFARALGLLKLPKMPELRGKRSSEGFEPADVDTDKIKYRCKQREKQRQARIRVQREEQKLNQNTDRSDTKDRLPRKGNHEKPPPKRKRKGRNKRMVEEWNRLALEERLYKKLRKGKISKAEYEEQIRGIDKKAEEEDDDDDDADDADATHSHKSKKRTKRGGKSHGRRKRGRGNAKRWVKRT